MNSLDLSAAVWIKSSRSEVNSGDCVEIAPAIPGLVPVRDSKVPHGPVLLINRFAWLSFIGLVRSES
ncbi:DUF397 domain-containing protein [Streptomyces phaeolivaceus]|uniref:DUF397 domain-containing protein n=1 Tax=Streptomyces phaeolivaceus TaxID=2653200 RepID=A0A5P8K9D0_9ACTN|nr:DUF397 domain-containing protein [Streptomyces phaeolivaceus]